MYNASKAAIAMASETWRHELEPLGVRTITLLTCAVKTNFFENYQEVTLPNTSKYHGIQDFIRTLTDGSMQAKAISSKQYATKVVQEVDKGATGTVWAGTDAFSARMVVALSPNSVIVSFEFF
jgi:short-subunit dehydrogenase